MSLLPPSSARDADISAKILASPLEGQTNLAESPTWDIQAVAILRKRNGFMRHAATVRAAVSPDKLPD